MNAVPIEIKELVIRAAIDPKSEGAKAGNGKAEASQQQTEELVGRCVEQVLEILRRQRER